MFAGALALVLGALMFGGEYGWGTVKTMLTQRPGRASVLGGQLLALAIALVTGVVVLFAARRRDGGRHRRGRGPGTGVAGRSPRWPRGSVSAAGAVHVGRSLGAVMGVVLRGVALPIGLGVVWVLGVENLVSVLAGSMLSCPAAAARRPAWCQRRIAGHRQPCRTGWWRRRPA